MKKFMMLMVAGLLMAGSVNAKKMQAHLSYATFYAATSGPYVETYLAINPASIMFKPINDTAFRGIVEVTMIFKNGDEIAAFEKYNLRSPIVTDTNNLKISLLDQKRFLLPSGDYTFTLLLADKYAGEKPYIINEPISISYHQDSIAFSDIQFIDNYRKTTSDNILSKSGYDLIPYPAEFFPENKTVLTFYTELYQTSQVLGTNEKFLLKYYLKSVNTGRILDNFVRIKRMETKEAVPILQNFNITDLASGNYLIIAEAYNKNNELMTKQQRFFKRNNPRIQIDPREVVALEIQNTFVNKLPEDSIREFIRMLNPIASETERYFIENNRENQDLDVLKNFSTNSGSPGRPIVRNKNGTVIIRWLKLPIKTMVTLWKKDMNQTGEKYLSNTENPMLLHPATTIRRLIRTKYGIITKPKTIVTANSFLHP